MLCHVITIWARLLELVGGVAKPFLNGFWWKKLQKNQRIKGYMSDTSNPSKTCEILWVTHDIPYLPNICSWSCAKTSSSGLYSESTLPILTLSPLGIHSMITLPVPNSYFLHQTLTSYASCIPDHIHSSRTHIYQWYLQPTMNSFFVLAKRLGQILTAPMHCIQQCSVKRW